MNALLLYPRFPESYWSFERTIELIGRKAVLPPLGLITVAAILPDHWEFRLVDRNVSDPTEDDWAWADIVLLSGMLVQRQDLLALIEEAHRRGKKVAVGGPYPTALPHELEEAGADYLVLDEGEITIPMWLADLERGADSGLYRSSGQKPDVTDTPIPRFDLLDFEAYSEMAVQYSRGCPFLCEFCDIIVLYGRKPRTKTPDQMLRELERLHELGWRRSIFVVDDNFIGNKRNAKEMLRELIPWMEDHGHPFAFGTEASVDLGLDQELMDLMTAAGFGTVFLGIETPDEESLVATRKNQNVRDSLTQMVRNIADSGLRISAGFIIGFDGEDSAAGDRIVRFVEENSIPLAFFSMLQALPGTALWKRLEGEGRLRAGDTDVNQTTLSNFVPTRPIEEIAEEYVNGFWELYDPRTFLDRTYRHYRILGEADCHKNPAKRKKKEKRPLNWNEVRGILVGVYRQGIARKTRFVFWRHLFSMYRHNPGGVMSYISVTAYIEHFLYYRETVKAHVESQLRAHIDQERSRPEPLPLPTLVASGASSA